jgi:hypothetical protein
MTMTLAFFVICSGIFVLQMSKINPKALNKAVVDKKSTLLLETARHEVDFDIEKDEDEDEGKVFPGTDAILADMFAFSYTGRGKTRSTNGGTRS